MSSTMSIPLASMMSDPCGARLASNDEYRRYSAAVSTSILINGTNDMNLKSVRYQLGRRFESAEKALQPHPDNDIPLFWSSYPLTSNITQKITALSKGHTMFSGNHTGYNLIGVVERISKGLAAWTLYDGVTAQTLAADMPLRCIAPKTFTAPVGVLSSCVFIPRDLDTQMSFDVFSILVHAIAGEGGSTMTDLVHEYAGGNLAHIPVVKGDLFPTACVDALRILAANFGASTAGDMFALGVVRGFHYVLNVVGHTDEGGFMSGVMRSGRFNNPYGVVLTNLPVYTGLPSLKDNEIESVSCFVDGITLMSAALVAHSDPGTVLNETWFPCVYTQEEAGRKYAQPGTDQTSTKDGVRSMINLLQADFSRFSKIYTSGLRKLFHFSDECGFATLLLNTMASHIDIEDHHLQFTSIAPYFWIEPTSLIDPNFLGSTAEREGFCSYGKKGAETSHNFWERSEIMPERSILHSQIKVHMRSARTSALIAHFLTNPKNGLSSCVPIGFNPSLIIFPGENSENPFVRDRLEEGVDITGYLWKRRKSPFPVPAEFMNIGSNMVLRIKHFTMDNEGNFSLGHICNKSEIFPGIVTFGVGIPHGIANGGTNEEPSSARRAHTRATFVLNNPRLRNAAFASQLSWSMIQG